MPEPKPVEELLKQIEGFDVDNLSVKDKNRLSEALQKKLGLNSGLNLQTLGGSQIIGSSVQFYFSENGSVTDIISVLVDKFGEESAIELIRIALEKTIRILSVLLDSLVSDKTFIPRSFFSLRLKTLPIFLARLISINNYC